MTYNTSLLLQGLEEYRAALENHRHVVAQEYAQLNDRWVSFYHVYEGKAADEFKAHWLRTQQRFEEYIEAARRIGDILDERIDALRQADREGDLG
jgi:uncharacterized protein YukE